MTLLQSPYTHYRLTQISSTDFFNIVYRLKIRHFIPMCLLVFDSAYLSYFLKDFEKLHDKKN